MSRGGKEQIIPDTYFTFTFSHWHNQQTKEKQGGQNRGRRMEQGKGRREERGSEERKRGGWEREEG